MDPALQIVIIVFCIIMSAYFSATETAFTTFNRIRMKNTAEKGNKRAALVLKLADKYDTLLSTILIGNNIVNILASSMATLLFIHIVRDNDLGSLLSTVVLTVVILIFGEISPKTVAKKLPESFAMFSAPIINVLLILLFPLTIIFKGLQKLLGRIFKSDDDQGMTEEELISIIEEAEEEGDFDKEESTLIKSAIEFGDLEVADIFTPRIDITAIKKDATAEEIKNVFNESGYSRLPVYEGDLDNVIGILNYKDFFASDFEDGNDITEITKPVMYVTKTQKINDLLRELQEKQRHIAIVTDEYGSTAGLVSLEDILEEIVGDIWDEHDEIIEEIKEVGEGEYIVSGKANIEKFFEELDIEEDEELDALTVNGWAMAELGKIPEVGDKFEADGLSVEVLEMDGRRIENLHVTDVREQESEEDDDKPRRSRKDEDAEETV